jgi:hypothetical protein
VHAACRANKFPLTVLEALRFSAAGSHPRPQRIARVCLDLPTHEAPRRAQLIDFDATRLVAARRRHDSPRSRPQSVAIAREAPRMLATLETWLACFERRAANPAELPDLSELPPLAAAERERIGRSLAIFQLGSSPAATRCSRSPEGRRRAIAHPRSCASRSAS